MKWNNLKKLQRGSIFDGQTATFFFRFWAVCPKPQEYARPRGWRWLFQRGDRREPLCFRASEASPNSAPSGTQRPIAIRKYNP